MCSTDTPASSEDFRGITAASLKQLSSHLTQWRGMLPQGLQWPGNDSTSFPTPQNANSGWYGQQLDSNLSRHQTNADMLISSSDLDQGPRQYPYIYDIQVAFLRSRYYYARYMAYRPFVYKALHFPEQMTQEDAEGVAECLRVSYLPLYCRWEASC
jgi:hypothetical protein